VDNAEGATVDLGSEPPHEAVTTAAATASMKREASGLGRCNDISDSWRKFPTVDFSNMPLALTQKVNHELRRCFAFRWAVPFQVLPIEVGN
jgi:hypothetical protein